MTRQGKRFQGFLIFAACLLVFQTCQVKPDGKSKPGWPVVTREAKPWTRWWWHGNALSKEGITAEMEAYQKAGLGGLEITPIYGVYGYEDRFVDFLSPQWMDLLIHTLREAERLDMGIDMATGTGWPFGGPWVKAEDACRDMNLKVYELKGGRRLAEKIEFVQEPLLRAVGNSIYELSDPLTLDKGRLQAPRNDRGAGKIDIKQLVEPISVNKNLQVLALDQVKFEKPLALKALMAYGESNEVIDLTKKVDSSGTLDWVAPTGNWKLYAVFEGWHGKMVERAGPGGEGNVIDHFSADALVHYLHRFDSAFTGRDIESLRGFFNDSYEVDDARGAADWTPRLFEEFKKLKGYDLRDHLPALFAKGEEEDNKRILCDYREVISELLLSNFTQPWKTWAHGKSAIVRNQAHGSPSNILDLYATIDIPEIEGIEPLRIRMASSAGNVTGKRLVSSESATWLNEHFQSSLSDIKVAVDRFMLNGINHIFYHGTSYSPPGEPWPGWLFYAAVHLNPRNSLWNDFDALNSYVARCQSFLQNTTPDNDVLLYYPVYDRFSTPGAEMIEHFDGIGRQFSGTAFEKAADAMLEAGFTFDYISDKQIGNITVDEGILKTEGNSLYKTILIPQCQFIPLRTLQKVLSLAEAGATVLVLDGLPAAVSGYSNLDNNKAAFESLINELNAKAQVKNDFIEMEVGKGRVLMADQPAVLLTQASVRRERMTDAGIQFIRKRTHDLQHLYMIANSKEQAFVGWLPLESGASSIVLYDPMSGEWGSAQTRKGESGQVEVYVQLSARQTLILETEERSESPLLPYYSPAGATVPLNGKWKIDFISGGPNLPGPVAMDTLFSWTAFGENDYPAFSGTASYTLSFGMPVPSESGWLLDLGVVKESAEVFINNQPMGTLIGPAYQLHLDPSVLAESNVLEVRVSNLMANRMADLDRRGVRWKKFYNVNFPARKPENRKNGLFDASQWPPRESGLLGPVLLTPVAKVN